MNGDLVQKADLDGKRIITETLPYLHSVALGIFFNVGSRDDGSERQGLTHFIEHMLFKGSRHRSAKDISYTIESRGGVIDGFTGRDTTGIYARCTSDHLVPVLGLLGEILSEPAFDPAEFAKEKDVVSEEIKSTEENPEDLAMELLLKAIYAPHPLSYPVTGSEASIRGLDRDETVDFYRRSYSRDRSLVVAVGDLTAEAIHACIRESLVLPAGGDGPVRTPPPVREPRVETRRRADLTQVYVSLGIPVKPFTDDRRYSQAIFNTAFGGGLSSRLFQRLREDEGLVYSVSSFLEMAADSGVFGIFFIADKQKLGRTIRTIFEEIDTLRADRFRAEELDIARNLTTGTTILSLENPSARMMRWARLELVLGRLPSVDESLEGYRRVSADDVNRHIDEMFSGQPFHAAGVGPLQSDELAVLLKERT